MNQFLFNKIDLVVLPVLMLIIIAFLLRQRKKQPAEVRRFFLKGFFLRVLGMLTASALTEFYYKFGDTYSYYYNAQILRKLFFKDPVAWFQVIFSNPEKKSAAILNFVDTMKSYDFYSGVLFQNNYNATVCKVASVFNIICFDSSLGIALIFALLSFLGCWYIFKVFVRCYPGYERQFAFLCLYLPSLWFWGSLILKDPLCLYSLGLIIYFFFKDKKGLFKRMLMIGLGIFFLLNLKPYIFYCFGASVVLGWLMIRFSNFNFLGKMSMIILAAHVFIFSYSFISVGISNAFDDVIKDSQTFIKNTDFLTKNGYNGESTILPKFDPTPAGLALLGLNGFVMVFLRPFPWELNKFIYIFLILENLLIYYLIFKKIKTGPLNFNKNYLLLRNFSFLFFIFLGLIVGITTFNFGTIARYRVPALPFLFAGIFAFKLVRRKRKIDKQVFRAGALQINEIGKKA